MNDKVIYFDIENEINYLSKHFIASNVKEFCEIIKLIATEVIFNVYDPELEEIVERLFNRTIDYAYGEVSSDDYTFLIETFHAILNLVYFELEKKIIENKLDSDIILDIDYLAQETTFLLKVIIE